jgi:hypothetical protein
MMREESTRLLWLRRVDEFLARMSWDETFRSMWQLVEAAIEQRYARPRTKIRARSVSSSTSAPAPALALRGIPASPSG